MTDEGDRNPKFYICRCFTTDNIFLKDYKLHVHFVTEQQFREDYRAVSARLLATIEVCFLKIAFEVARQMCVITGVYSCVIYC